MVNAIIRTKLHPPFVRPTLVPRPRLQERISRGLRGPMTLIAAPAGFGKTTLMASCMADCEFPTAWLSLDRDDNQERRFLSYLIAALRDADPAVGSEPAQWLKAQNQVPIDLILTGLINDLESTGSGVALVLDDYHFISNRTVHSAVIFLLDHCPRTFHLIILSRSDPPLPLGRLRARGQMVELRAADLSFTEAEAAHFLNDIMGLRLNAVAVAALEARTEGWIAGLQMAALSIQDREDVASFIEGFSGTNRYILDYLLEEVLAREPEEVRAFLLQTAILTRLSGPLCDAVTCTSGGQDMLEGLERRNLFVVPLDDERRWYRYHHLFSDLLQARLRRSEPDRVAKLLSRAAAWCEHHGEIAEAVGYAFAADDHEMAARLVARYWKRATNQGEIETVWTWLNALPGDTVRSSGPLSVAYCWMLWIMGRFDALDQRLADAERAMGEGMDGDEFAELPAQLAALRAFAARYRGEFNAATMLAERALSLLPEGLSPRSGAQLRALSFLALASARDGAGDLENAADAYAESVRWSRSGANPAGVTGSTYRLSGILRTLGRLRAAEAACRETLAYIQEEGMARFPAAGILHLALGEVLVEKNDLEDAQSHLVQGVELGKWSGRLDAVRNAAPILVRLRQAEGDLAGALAAIKEAKATLGASPSRLAKAELLALKASILIRQGETGEAAQCAKESQRLAGADRGQTGQMAALSALRVLLAENVVDEAVSRLAQALANAEDAGRLGAALELHILRALALAKRGDREESEVDLEKALALAEPEGYVRVFLDEGQPIQMLIAEWSARADAGPTRDYAACLLAQFEIQSSAQGSLSPNDALAEPLSDRELEVLHIMAMGKTNREIARQLFIAPGTVKAHTASIYRKLDVTNRTEAVARARQIGILP